MIYYNLRLIIYKIIKVFVRNTCLIFVVFWDNYNYLYMFFEEKKQQNNYVILIIFLVFVVVFSD